MRNSRMWWNIPSKFRYTSCTEVRNIKARLYVFVFLIPKKSVRWRRHIDYDHKYHTPPPWHLLPIPSSSQNDIIYRSVTRSLELVDVAVTAYRINLWKYLNCSQQSHTPNMNTYCWWGFEYADCISWRWLKGNPGTVSGSDSPVLNKRREWSYPFVVITSRFTLTRRSGIYLCPICLQSLYKIKMLEPI